MRIRDEANPVVLIAQLDVTNSRVVLGRLTQILTQLRACRLLAFLFIHPFKPLPRAQLESPHHARTCRARVAKLVHQRQRTQVLHPIRQILEHVLHQLLGKLVQRLLLLQLYSGVAPPRHLVVVAVRAYCLALFVEGRRHGSFLRHVGWGVLENEQEQNKSYMQERVGVFQDAFREL